VINIEQNCKKSVYIFNILRDTMDEDIGRI